MTDTPLCPNCDAPRLGPFCQNCGQKETGRLTVKGFLATASSRLFSLDRGLLHTVTGMFRTPGQVPWEVVHGKRARYTNPLTYWLIAATIQLLALSTIQEGYLGYITASLDASFEQQPQASEVYAQLFGVEDPKPILAQVFLKAIKGAYTYLGVCFAMAFALFLRLFTSFDRKNHYNYAEQLVFALYIIGHWTLFTGLILPVTFRLSPLLHGTIGSFGYLAISAWASLDFHRAGGKGAFMAALSMVLAFVAYMLVLIVVMMLLVLIEAAG